MMRKMQKNKKVVSTICLLLANILFFAGGVATVVQADSRNFYYTLVEQAKSNWCWAASAENSVRWERSITRDQYDAVKKLKGTLINPYPNKAGSLKDIEKAAEYISKSKETYSRTDCSLTSGVKSFKFLKKEVDNSDVTVVVGGYYSNNTRTGGHASVVVGYEVSGGTNYLVIYNPWQGSRDKVKYTTFKSGYGSRKYDGTVWNAE